MDKARLKRLDFRLLSMVFILVGLWILFRMKTGPFYFSGDSIGNLTRDMATWTILAAGMTLVIVAGHIDLSVGSLLALVAAACAQMINPEHGLGWSASVAVPLALALGLGVGLCQGMLIAYFRVPAFIITLAGLFILRGFTQKVSAFDPRVPDSSWVCALGFQHLSPAKGWVLAVAVCVVWAVTVLWGRARRKRLGIEPDGLVLTALKIGLPAAALLAFTFRVNQAAGMPAQTLAMALVLLVVHFVARHTRFGRHVFAVGGNAEAARLSGISVEKVTVGVFAIMGLLAGVAGVIWMAQNQGSTKDAGTFYELYAIAACVIGGTSLIGGRGSIFGTFLGGLVMATVIQGMDYTDLENWLQLVVRGAVVAIAVGIDVAGKDPAPWMRRVAGLFRRQGRGTEAT